MRYMLNECNAGGGSTREMSVPKGPLNAVEIGNWARREEAVRWIVKSHLLN